MEERKAQQDNRFLKGGDIAYMIYVFFKISEASEALLDLNDLLSPVEELQRVRLRHQLGRSTCFFFLKKKNDAYITAPLLR